MVYPEAWTARISRQRTAMTKHENPPFPANLDQYSALPVILAHPLDWLGSAIQTHLILLLPFWQVVVVAVHPYPAHVPAEMASLGYIVARHSWGKLVQSKSLSQSLDDSSLNSESDSLYEETELFSRLSSLDGKARTFSNVRKGMWKRNMQEQVESKIQNIKVIKCKGPQVKILKAQYLI